MYLTFPNQLGVERVRSAEGTIKILLKSDFSSDLTHFHAGIWGPSQRGGPCPVYRAR